MTAVTMEKRINIFSGLPWVNSAIRTETIEKKPDRQYGHDGHHAQQQHDGLRIDEAHGMVLVDHVKRHQDHDAQHGGDGLVHDFEGDGDVDGDEYGDGKGDTFHGDFSWTNE
jgi:hypothetical protein